MRAIPRDGEPPSQYERETYEGRCISQSRELGMGYCGSGPLEGHVKQMRDPDCWVQSCHEDWHKAYLEAEQEKAFDKHLIQQLEDIVALAVRYNYNCAADFIEREIQRRKKKEHA